MATIKGIEGMTPEQLNAEIAQGGRFVVYQYCVSFLILTLKRSSDVQFIRAGESASSKALPFTLTSLAFGWWGIPWGPIYTIQSISTNSKGGVDVTPEILAQLHLPVAPYAEQPQPYPQYPQQQQQYPPPQYPPPQYPQYPQYPQPQPPQYPPQPPPYPPRPQ